MIDQQKTCEVIAAAKSNNNIDRQVALCCLSCLDHTTLSESDTQSSINNFVDQVMNLSTIGLPPVASVCVYPSMVESVGLALGDSSIAITSVAGGFPAAQTYLEVKILEVAMAIENGADEIDIVLNVGAAMESNFEIVRSEIETIAQEIDGEAILKVILESGTLADPQIIYRAAYTAMEAGADFIKTSTGKTTVAATPQAVAIMCQAIADYHLESGRRVGIKVAGGVNTLEDAILYYNIVKSILGKEWLSSDLFRIGSSKLLSILIDYLVD